MASIWIYSQPLEKPQRTALPHSIPITGAQTVKRPTMMTSDLSGLATGMNVRKDVLLALKINQM